MGEPHVTYLSGAVALLTWQFVFLRGLAGARKNLLGLRGCKRFRGLSVRDTAGGGGRQNERCSLFGAGRLRDQQEIIVAEGDIEVQELRAGGLDQITDGWQAILGVGDEVLDGLCRIAAACDVDRHPISSWI